MLEFSLQSIGSCPIVRPSTRLIWLIFFLGKPTVIIFLSIYQSRPLLECLFSYWIIAAGFVFLVLYWSICCSLPLVLCMVHNRGWRGGCVYCVVEGVLGGLSTRGQCSSSATAHSPCPAAAKQRKKQAPKHTISPLISLWQMKCTSSCNENYLRELLWKAMVWKTKYILEKQLFP